MGKNAYYLKLMSILLFFSLRNWWTQPREQKHYFCKKQIRGIRKKYLVAYLLELIQVTQKEIMIQTMNLVKCKYLSVNLNKKRKEKENKIKELDDKTKK